MTTFAVSDVSRGELYEPLDAVLSVRRLLVKRVEALAFAGERLVSCDTLHPFAKAVHDAFYDHHPLVIRPDDIWFCIAQGFATHVAQNNEELRSRFVAHAGKLKLVVERPDFELGQPNPWPEAFEAFSIQIGQHVGKLKDLISARYSTTTPIEAAAFDVCLMDTFQGYFEYEMRIGCGIPEITLLGTPEDWASMIPRVQQLAKYGLETWASALVPVLEKLADTANGKVDQAFWRSFFRYRSGSVGSELTGWILTLFPYLVTDGRTKAVVRNQHLAGWKARFDVAQDRGRPAGPSLAALPSGLVSAPVLMVHMVTGKKTEMRFVAGMLGVRQDAQTRALSASFGWAVVYESEPARGLA